MAALPSWGPDILGSALTLGFYDVSKKHAVSRNALLPVLFGATFCGSLAVVAATALTGHLVEVLAVSGRDALRVVVKTLLVTGSWLCVYHAMRELPISIVAPIRASAPLWTLLGALPLYGEWPRPAQVAGMVLVFAGYGAFALAGRREGIVFHRTPAVLTASVGTLLGAASALYDKHLLQPCGLSRLTMQFWFSVDLVAFLLVAWGVRRALPGPRTPFAWRWTIPLTGLLLVLSDWLYFRALSGPGVPVSILSLVRRSSVAVSFGLGAWVFRDRQVRAKLAALVLLLSGVALLCLC